MDSVESKEIKCTLHDINRRGSHRQQSGGWGLISTHSFFSVLKRIQTPHSWFWDFRAETTRWSGCRVQVWVQVWPPACHLAITPKGYSRRQSKVLTAKSMAKLLGPRSGTAWAGRTGEHKHRAFPSRRQSLRAATGSLEENMLPLLRYWLSSIVKKVLMLRRYWAMTTDFFFIGKWSFHGIDQKLKQRPSLRSILRCFIGLWVKIWHRNKTACSELNPVQSSRSKSTTSPR